ncbi:hypothetical protein [uncultured Gammaproteobacteria bacterium]|nr:hypothetical protein [uncultured Gammaproteobacteria bacterium]
MNKIENSIKPQNKLIVFQGKDIRKTWHKEVWFYSLVNVIAVLSGSKNPTSKKYAKKTRNQKPNKSSTYYSFIFLTGS